MKETSYHHIIRFDFQIGILKKNKKNSTSLIFIFLKSFFEHFNFLDTLGDMRGLYMEKKNPYFYDFNHFKRFLLHGKHIDEHFVLWG